MTTFLNLGDPAERLRSTITRALELRRDHWTQEGFLYRGGGDFLLRHGSFYVGRELPAQYRPLMGGESRCFENALAAAKADPTLRYCEGVYCTGYGAPTPHAWCLDPDGGLLELTMPTDAETVARMLNRVTKMAFLPPERWSYFGAVFHPEYVQAVVEAHGCVGMFDRPVHDLLEAIDPSGVTDDREDWIVLRQPYDPERTKP